MLKPRKNRTHTPAYNSPNQLVLARYENPLKKMNPNKRWVVLFKLLPCDELSSLYWKYFPEKSMVFRVKFINKTHNTLGIKFFWVFNYRFLVRGIKIA